MISYFQDGGAYMYFVLQADLLVLVLVCVAYFLKSRVYRVVCMMLCLIPLSIGYVGYEGNMTIALSALESVDPGVRSELLAESKSVAQIPLIFGLVSSFIFIIMVFLSKFSHR